MKRDRMFEIALCQGTCIQEMLFTTITICHNNPHLSLKDLQFQPEINISNLSINSLQRVMRITTNNMAQEIFNLRNRKMLCSHIFYGSFSGL